MIDIRDGIACLLLLCNPTNYFRVVSKEWDTQLNKILDDFEYITYEDIGCYRNRIEYLIHDNVKYQIGINQYGIEMLLGRPLGSLYKIRDLTTNQIKDYYNDIKSYMRPKIRTQLRYILKVSKERRAYLRQDLFSGEFDD